jgi:hypothetical protein
MSTSDVNWRQRGRFMIKNIFLLGVLAWASFSYAKNPIAKESLGDAESYKVERASEEQEAQRSVAGARIKKSKKHQDVNHAKDAPVSESDSEVRYWQYSE